VNIWLKIDSGSGRTGLPWDQPTAIASLAQAVGQSEKTRLRGLLTHAGNTYSASSPAEICQRYQDSVSRMTSLRTDLWDSAHGLLEVSVGDTPGCTVCPDLGQVDEIRPGNFVFYDGQMLRLGVCQPSQIAAVLACPVVALHPERGEVLVYGGAIHLSKDVVIENSQPHYGYVVHLNANGEWSAPLTSARVSRLSQEHGILSLPAAEIDQLRVGDWLGVIPAHICLTVAALGDYLTLDGTPVTTYKPAEPA
ncbi:alanine racemase, partial [bacterium]|nr:alanine racemase [bacterium]